MFLKQKEIKVRCKLYVLVKHKWAKKMSALTCELSREKMISLLIVFVLITSSISFFIIYRSIVSESSDIIYFESISKPLQMNFESKAYRPFSISSQENKRMIHFISYLDSLKASPSGKKTYDSIIANRQGLMDSLVFIENYYKSNVKE